jgi:hypothetical protein
LLLNVEYYSNDFFTVPHVGHLAELAVNVTRGTARRFHGIRRLPISNTPVLGLRAKSATSSAAEDPEMVRTPAVGVLEGKGESQEEAQEGLEDEPPEGEQMCPWCPHHRRALEVGES